MFPENYLRRSEAWPGTVFFERLLAEGSALKTVTWTSCLSELLLSWGSCKNPSALSFHSPWPHTPGQPRGVKGFVCMKTSQANGLALLLWACQLITQLLCNYFQLLIVKHIQSISGPIVSWIMPFKKIPWSPNPEDVTLFGNRIFADVLMLRCSHTRVEWTLYPKTGVPIKIKKHGETQRLTGTKAMWWQRQSLEGCRYKPRDAKDC